MSDEIIFGLLVFTVLLTWYFAIRKSICHYKLLKNSNYGFLTKFFVLGIPFLFILPNNTITDDNKSIYKKGFRYLTLLIITFILCYFLLYALL